MKSRRRFVLRVSPCVRSQSVPCKCALRHRHCERSEAIQGPCIVGPWIASSQGLLAMTDGALLTRSIR